jgi:hypothetical protein
MTRLRTRRVLNTGAALVALASVTACALPYPGTAAAIPLAGTPSLRTGAGPGGRTSCANERALGCALPRPRDRAAGHGLRAGGGHVRAPQGGESSHTRPARDALSRVVFLKHLASCARQYPVIRQAPPERVLAVGLHESGLSPLAIHDNTTARSHYPETLEQAVAMAASLRRAGHRIDAGVMQVSHANWAAYGLTVESVFDARANICAGARILGEAYLIERRAACRYNTGRPDCANGYPDSIDRAFEGLKRATPPLGTGAAPPGSAALAD